MIVRAAPPPAAPSSSATHSAIRTGHSPGDHNPGVRAPAASPRLTFPSRQLLRSESITEREVQAHELVDPAGGPRVGGDGAHLALLRRDRSPPAGPRRRQRPPSPPNQAPPSRAATASSRSTSPT